MFSFLVILLGLRGLVLLLGIDRLITVTWTTPLVLGFAIVAGSFAFMILFREMASAMAFPRAVVLTGMVAVAICLLLGILLGVLAQHIPGTMVESTAIVENEHHSGSSRTACRVKVKARSVSDGSEIGFCIRTARGRSVGKDDLEAGDMIIVRLRQTALGTVVESASRVP